MTARMVALMLALALSAVAGDVPTHGYKVLPGITRGSLTIFPVVTTATYNTHPFLTLDEGLRSGEVVVTESGGIEPLIRGSAHRRPPRTDRAQVNQLVLINNSSRPLLLLAGEIVTGGKQDRIIAKDRIVPPKSDPVDLGVFCVEQGRWTEVSKNFGSLSVQMAQPNVRKGAMASKNQAEVWSQVRESNAATVAAVPAAAPQVADTSSYGRVMNNKQVRDRVDSIAAPLEQDYRGLIAQLRDTNAVGVVAAVDGEVVWADIFASNDLLQKYWPKLVRSYAAQAVTFGRGTSKIDVREAQRFLDATSGTREIVESEPGVFRHAEISGAGFKVFELTSLLPKTGFPVHMAKMAE